MGYSSEVHFPQKFSFFSAPNQQNYTSDPKELASYKMIRTSVSSWRVEWGSDFACCRGRAKKFYISISRIAVRSSSVVCQSHSGGRSVGRSVTVVNPAKRLNRVAVWVENSGGPKQPCIRWGSDSRIPSAVVNRV